MVEALEPCPFCGWESIEVAYDSSPVRYFVRCQDCEAQTGNHEKPSTAIAAWNTRHRTATLQQVIDLANACVDQGIPLAAMVPMLEDMR